MAGADVQDTMSRSAGERVRIVHAVVRLRAHIDSIEIALRVDAPVGVELGQSIAGAAIDLAVLLAKLDAYQRAEADAH